MILKSLEGPEFILQPDDDLPHVRAVIARLPESVVPVLPLGFLIGGLTVEQQLAVVRKQMDTILKRIRKPSDDGSSKVILQIKELRQCAVIRKILEGLNADLDALHDAADTTGTDGSPDDPGGDSTLVPGESPGSEDADAA